MSSPITAPNMNVWPGQLAALIPQRPDDQQPHETSSEIEEEEGVEQPNDDHAPGDQRSDASQTFSQQGQSEDRGSREDVSEEDEEDQASSARVDQFEDPLIWGNMEENDAILRRELLGAYKPEEDIVARGVTRDRDNYLAIYECVLPKPQKINRQRGRSNSGQGIDQTLDRLERSVWVLARWQRLRETTTRPPDHIEMIDPEPVFVSGLSAGKSRFVLRENDGWFFSSLSMHIAAFVMLDSAVSPGFALAIRADIFASLKDEARERIKRQIRQRFADKVEEEEGRGGSTGTGSAQMQDPQAATHNLPLSQLEFEPRCADLVGQWTNFNLRGRALVRVNGEFMIWYGRVTGQDMEWISEEDVNPNISEAFKVWALHRVGIDRAINHVRCGLSACFLNPLPDSPSTTPEQYDRFVLSLHQATHAANGGSDTCPLLSTVKVDN